MLEAGMFLYPWDIGSMDEFRRDYPLTMCNAAAPALSYHHGSILSARNVKVYEIPEAALSFHPNSGLYDMVKPEVHKEAADAGNALKIREWCGQTDRHFSAWTVILHNSTLGGRHPEICVENVSGGKYRHALCPSNPHVKRYAEALMEDICGTFSPDSVAVESASVSTALHGSHHEISNVKVTPAILWLLSLCFCPHCVELAENDGGSPAKARETCAFLLKRLLNSETFFNGNGFEQISTLLLEYPELHAYQTARQRRVAEFIKILSGTVRKRGSEFRLMPSSNPFTVTSSFLAGTSFTAAAGLSDALLPLVYSEGETYKNVLENIRLTDSTTPVGMACTLNPYFFRDKASFLGTIAEAARQKPHCLYYYNYSMASAERLTWVAEASEAYGV